jgi:hypothetical protein
MTRFTLVPTLLRGNPVLAAPAARAAVTLERRGLHSHAAKGITAILPIGIVVHTLKGDE